jgi:hypothetical protein
VPNITSTKKRPAGIAKGLWKAELNKQLTGSYEKKGRRGKRTHSKDKKESSDDKGGLLGKRTKTATSHAKGTKTFKRSKK